jgi:signal transduction histidine kinase
MSSTRADSRGRDAASQVAGGAYASDPRSDRSGSAASGEDPGTTTSAETHGPAAGRQTDHDHDRRDRRRRRPGTAGRLALFHALVLALVLGVVVAALVRQFSSSYEGIAARALTGELESFAAQHPPAGEPLLRTAARYFHNHELPAGTVVSVGDPAGHYVAAGDWASAFVADPAIRHDLLAPPARTLALASTVAGRSVELLVAPIILDGRVIGSFVAASDLAPFRADRSRVLTLSLAEATVALVAGVLSTFWLLRRLLRTVGGITATAEEIGAGDVERRLGDQGTDDEVGQLARTFDKMLDRLQAAMEAQRRLLSDVSHQLRTPLTVARGHLEVLQRTGTRDPEAVNETISVVVDELDHMRTLVEQLLLLGRAMEPDFVSPEPIDLRSFLADIDASARVLADRDFRLPEIPDLVIHTDPAKLRGAVLNLVDNAIRATAPGDVIQISAELVEGSGAVKIAVDDAGPGIPEDVRPLLLGRFERAGSADGGQGLGLAIVKAVAEAHRGSVSIETSRFGGCRVEVILPATLVEVPVTVDESPAADVADDGSDPAPES